MSDRYNDVPPDERDVLADGATESHQRASFSDPVAGNVDPTSPESPANTLEWQREDSAAADGRVRQASSPDARNHDGDAGKREPGERHDA